MCCCCGEHHHRRGYRECPHHREELTASELEAYKKWLEDVRAKLDQALQDLERRIRELEEREETEIERQ